MWHKQSFTQFWSQSDAYSRRSSLKLTYIHHPLVVCTHQICCAVAVPIALSQDRLLHGHNRLVNWTPCSRRRESKLKNDLLIKCPISHKHLVNQRSVMSFAGATSPWRYSQPKVASKGNRTLGLTRMCAQHCEDRDVFAEENKILGIMSMDMM